MFIAPLVPCPFPNICFVPHPTEKECRIAVRAHCVCVHQKPPYGLFYCVHWDVKYRIGISNLNVSLGAASETLRFSGSIKGLSLNLSARAYNRLFDDLFKATWLEIISFEYLTLLYEGFQNQCKTFTQSQHWENSPRFLIVKENSIIIVPTKFTSDEALRSQNKTFYFFALRDGKSASH